MSSRLRDAGRSIVELGTQMTLLTAPLTTFGVTGIHAAADFESSMAEIAARTGLMGDELERIADLSLQLGEQTTFSAQQAADAFLQLLTSGSSAAEAIAILPSVLDAAAAAGTDLGMTADAITDIMASFGLEASEAARISDALARASGASSASMDDMFEAFTNVGGVARSFGLSVEDTAAILAVFAENGLKGSRAGDQLRSMLLNLSSDTASTREAWEMLGTSLYDATGRIRPLEDVLRDIALAAEDMTDEERQRAFQQLAGSYGILGLEALTSSISIGEMKDRMGDTAGAADVAAARMDTFQGRLDALKSSVETLSITALTPLMQNVLQPLVEQMTGVIGEVTAWAEANPELAQSLGQIGLVAIVAGPALVALGTVISSIGTVIGLLTGAIGLLGGALAALLSPLGIAMAAGVALVAAYLTNFGGLRDFIDNEVRPRLEEFFNFLGQIWEQVRPALEALYDWFVVSALPAIADFVTNTVVPAVGSLIALLSNIWNMVGSALGSVFAWFSENMPRIVEWVNEAVGAVRGLIDSLVELGNRLGGGLEAYGGVGENAGVIGEGLSSGQFTLGDVLGAAIGAIGAEIQPRASGGPVIAGQAYVVGDGGGPELFVPRSSGRIIPNDELRGGTSVNVYLTAYGQSPYELVDMIERTLRERGY